MKRSPSPPSRKIEPEVVVAPVVHTCPKCGRPGLAVTGTRETGLTHDHTRGDAGVLGVGGCGYFMIWKPLPPFVPQPIEPPRMAWDVYNE